MDTHQNSQQGSINQKSKSLGGLTPIPNDEFDHDNNFELNSLREKHLKGTPSNDTNTTESLLTGEDILAESWANNRKRTRLFYQSVVVLLGFLSYFIYFGLAFSLAVFFPYWIEEFYNGIAKTALIQSVHVGLLFGAGSLVGLIIDNFGVKRTLFLGSILSSLGFLGAVFASSTNVLIVSVGLIAGFGICCMNLATMVSICSMSTKSASITMGISYTGGGIGQSVLPYLCRFLAETYGWRGAFYILAGISLQTVVIGYLMSLLLNEASEARSAKTSYKAKQKSMIRRLKSVCNPRYILTCCATSSGFLAVNGFFIIVVDYAKQQSGGDGVFYIFLISTSGTTSNLIMGFINKLTFTNSSILLSLSVTLLGAGLIGLSFVTENLTTVFVIVLFGIGYGGMICISGIVILDLVGQELLSLAIGITMTTNGVASSLGGVLFGYLYELTQSYQAPLITLGGMAAVLGCLPALGMLVSKRLNAKLN